MRYTAQPKFVEGEVVIYQNGDSFELGVIKQIVPYAANTYLKEQGFPPTGEPVGLPVIKFDYFVNYHTGDTAAKTPEDCLHKIVNKYAFDIARRSL
jgi:hypothetical protein